MSDSGLIQDFQEKSKEVKQYCLWLKNVESNNDSIKYWRSLC